MLSFRKPSVTQISDFLVAQSHLNFSYQAIGATANTPPTGYAVDHTRAKLGEGPQVFEAAVAAIHNWQQFEIGWLSAHMVDTSIKKGTTVAILAHVMGGWWLNSCRIVYVMNESGSVNQFGFAYGTLPGHAESGEERFLVEWNQLDNNVWYDILAFSRPRHVLARLGYPLTRCIQKRFATDSVAALRKAVTRATSD